MALQHMREEIARQRDRIEELVSENARLRIAYHALRDYGRPEDEVEISSLRDSIRASEPRVISVTDARAVNRALTDAIQNGVALDERVVRSDAMREVLRMRAKLVRDAVFLGSGGQCRLRDRDCESAVFFPTLGFARAYDRDLRDPGQYRLAIVDVLSALTGTKVLLVNAAVVITGLDRSLRVVPQLMPVVRRFRECI